MSVRLLCDRAHPYGGRQAAARAELLSGSNYQRHKADRISSSSLIYDARDY